MARTMQTARRYNNRKREFPSQFNRPKRNVSYVKKKRKKKKVNNDIFESDNDEKEYKYSNNFFNLIKNERQGLNKRIVVHKLDNMFVEPENISRNEKVKSIKKLIGRKRKREELEKNSNPRSITARKKKKRKIEETYSNDMVLVKMNLDKQKVKIIESIPKKYVNKGNIYDHHCYMLMKNFIEKFDEMFTRYLEKFAKKNIQFFFNFLYLSIDVIQSVPNFEIKSDNEIKMKMKKKLLVELKNNIKQNEKISRDWCIDIIEKCYNVDFVFYEDLIVEIAKKINYKL